MEIIPLKIPDVLLLKPKIFGDQRGYFYESFNLNEFKSKDIEYKFVQDNRASSKQGILRGLHYQVNYPQGKLVSVISGEIVDVAIDIRPSSSTFGKHILQNLKAENKEQMYIPPGFAHGYYVLSESAEFFYKCTDFYSPENERCLRWDDPALAIDWPLISEPTLNERDRKAPLLDELNLKENICGIKVGNL